MENPVIIMGIDERGRPTMGILCPEHFKEPEIHADICETLGVIQEFYGFKGGTVLFEIWDSRFFAASPDELAEIGREKLGRMYARRFAYLDKHPDEATPADCASGYRRKQ